MKKFPTDFMIIIIIVVEKEASCMCDEIDRMSYNYMMNGVD